MQNAEISLAGQETGILVKIRPRRRHIGFEVRFRSSASGLNVLITLESSKGRGRRRRALKTNRRPQINLDTGDICSILEQIEKDKPKSQKQADEGANGAQLSPDFEKLKNLYRRRPIE